MAGDLSGLRTCIIQTGACPGSADNSDFKEKNMNRNIRRFTRFLLLPLMALVLLSGCISAAKLLEKAERAWSMGLYFDAIDGALQSYEKAVDKNKEQAEIDASREFLIERFPLFNENLSKIAENQLSGTDTDKAKAWETYQQLVQMNSRIGNSIASSFLETVDYSTQLRNAKDVAAQIKYVKSLELIGQDQRSSYIEAVGLLLEINNLVPGYRDIGNLLKLSYQEGTLVIAFSDRSLYFNYNTENSDRTVDLRSEMDTALRDYIKENDYPDFLKFITAGSVKSAEDAGAVLFVDVQGDIWIDSEVVDSYSNGSITWTRSYEGTPSILVTRIKDTRNEIAPVSLELSQSVSIEFFPVRYNTESLTQDMFYNQFNNIVWMTDQLNGARAVLDDQDGSVDMLIWAEMKYGGLVNFLKSAIVNAPDGDQDLPIDVEVYKETKEFINDTLPDFLEFKDMDVEDQIINQTFDGFLSKSGVKELLTNLEG